MDTSSIERSFRLRDFSRLRDLISSASRPGSIAASSIVMDDSVSDSQSIFHYDIREPDSLMQECVPELSVSRAPSIVIEGDYVPLTSRRSLETSRSIQFTVRGVSCGSQTITTTDPEDLDQLRNELIPNLETELAIRDSSIASGESKYNRLLSRMMNYTLFARIISFMGSDTTSSSGLIGVDKQSIDLYREADDESPIASINIKAASLRVSAKHGEAHLFSLKTLVTRICPDSMPRFKVLLYVFKQLGVAVTVVDIPVNALEVKQLDSSNPRRLVTRDQ